MKAVGNILPFVSPAFALAKIANRGGGGGGGPQPKSPVNPNQRFGDGYDPVSGSMSLTGKVGLG